MHKPWTVSLINTILGFVELVLGLRFVLQLVSASPSAPFMRWVLSISEPLLTPFRGMFPAPILEHGVILEFTTLFALVVYELVRFLLLRLISYIAHRTGPRME